MNVQTAKLKGALAAMAVLIGLFSVGRAQAGRVRLNVAPNSPMLIAGQAQRAYVKIGLTGFDLESAQNRTPVNVAIVLDRSGSMSGEKIWKAKEAAKMAVSRLGPQDIVSVIAYNHGVEVLVPATKATDKSFIFNRIDSLAADGNTALFSGVSKGAAELRKFRGGNRVNRVILLSDGLANVGPSSPAELADFGASLIKEGISVTTIGLGMGYNEDLMASLARSSDGNHAFAETADDLNGIFTFELGDLLAVVANDVLVEIQCPPGVRPMRVLGRDAQIFGQKVVAKLNQIYSNQEKFLLLEVDIPASKEGEVRRLASVNVKYNNTITKTNDNLEGGCEVGFTASRDLVDHSENKDVTVSSIELLTNEANRHAMELRDKGKTLEARKMLDDNAAYLDKTAKKYKSKKLKSLSVSNKNDSDNLDGERWTRQRKEMRKRQFELDQQQAW
jgi:Ca-activated chloride channel family protein